MTDIMKLNREISIEVHGKKNMYVKYNNMVDKWRRPSPNLGHYWGRLQTKGDS
jgi:hypothetical protein